MKTAIMPLLDNLPYTGKFIVWQLQEWANDEIQTGNRIKAVKLKRMADKYKLKQGW